MPSLRERIEQARVDASTSQAQPAASNGSAKAAEDVRAKIRAKVQEAADRSKSTQTTPSTPATQARWRGIPMPEAMYRKTSVLIALICADVLWISVYLLYAFSTSWGSQGAIMRIAEALNRVIYLVDPSSTFTLSMTASWMVGFLIAFGSTSIEIHLWRVGHRKLFYSIGVPVMFWDIFTSSRLVQFMHLGSFIEPSTASAAMHTGIGSGIAIIPEPMIVLTTVTIVQVIRNRRVIR